MNCTTCKAAMSDLLLDPASAKAVVREHVSGCADCAQELAELQKTFALLDEWKAPEISPYFDQKLAVGLREEEAAQPASWIERMRARLLFNTGRQFRPAMIGAMAVVLLAGGGGVGITTHSRMQRAAAESATVNDLQILDKNEQAMEQVDQLLQDDTPDDNDAPQS